MFSSIVPEGYVFSFEEYLFNRHKHRITQVASGWQSYYWLDKKKRLVVASFHCHLHEGVAVSPFSATFGGIDFDEKLALRDLSAFVESINTDLKKREAKRITITIAPQIYNNAKFILVYQALMDNGYEVKNSRISSTLLVDQNAFDSKIHKSERKKLRQTHKNQYQFKVENDNSYSSIYQLIKTCRKERELKLSMSEALLGRVVQALPSEFHFFSLRDDLKIIAAAICVNTSSDVLYVFYGGHLKAYNKLSPVVMLYEGIYQYAQSEKLRLIDYGTSHGEMQTDHDLLDFKQYIGCTSGLAITFECKK
ncbi:MAG TPA: GNAT family N-acetyltransferase [Fulvivirga sp.]|nr:GNAT family N-acetyltransferase [Fulvivirga sp.]